MGEKPALGRQQPRAPGEAMISAISVGAVFILFGLVFVLALPNNLWDRTVAFFSSFTTREVTGLNITLPAPMNPSAHTVFYTAVFQFSLGIALLQILILALRIGFRSPFGRIAETIGNLVFWFGATYLQSVYLNSTTTLSEWFMFWAAVIVVVGLSIIARAVILIIRR